MKEISAITPAAGASAYHCAPSSPGHVGSGSPAGTSPSSATPGSSTSAPAVVAAITTVSAFPRKPPIARSRATAAAPSASVGRWIAPACCASAESSGPSPPLGGSRRPSSGPSWLAMISSAAADVKPRRTGSDRKLTTNPSRSAPVSAWKSPARIASPAAPAA